MGCCSTLAVGQSLFWAHLHLISMVGLLVANGVVYENNDTQGNIAGGSPCLELSRYMLFEAVWAVVGLGYFLLLTLWRWCDEKSFWKSGTIKFNLVLGVIYLTAGAAAAFGGGYLYNRDGDNCIPVTHQIPNLAVADAIAGVVIRIPYALIALSLLIFEATEPGALRTSFDSLTESATGTFVTCAIKNVARLYVFIALYVLGLIPLLIANGVVITKVDAVVYSSGNPCLFLYRYCEFETVYPIAGLGFCLFAFLCRAVSHEGFKRHFRVVLVTFVIFVTAGLVVLLYAIKLVVDNGDNCRVFSDAIPNMALIDIIANGVFRIPFFVITLFCMLNLNVNQAANDSVELKSPK